MLYEKLTFKIQSFTTSYAELDYEKPDKQRWAIKAKDVTLGKILDALFPGRVRLPPAVNRTGFPNELQISWVPPGFEPEWSPVPGVTFPMGLYVKGDFNFFDIKGNAEIALTLSDKIKFHLELDAWKIPASSGSIILVSRSSSDTTHGPFINFEVTGIKEVPKLNGTGYVSLLSGLIMGEASVLIEDVKNWTVLTVSTASKVLFWTTQVDVAASFPPKDPDGLPYQWWNLGFSAYFSMENIDELNKFAAMVLTLISGWFEFLGNQLKSAQAAVDNLIGPLEEQAKKICNLDACSHKVSERTCVAQQLQRMCPRPPRCKCRFNAFVQC